MRHVDPREARRKANALAGRQALRAHVERVIECLIDVLDDLDGDPDFEPSLGSVGSGWGAAAYDQVGWATGGDCDEREFEDEHGGDVLDEGEDALGWTSDIQQLSLGESTDDGDLTAPERHGCGFVLCGADDSEQSGAGGG